MKFKSLSTAADWRDLYAAALFEDDKSQIAARVAEAELAMVERARSLFISSDPNRREVIELDQSLRMLRLLKTCLVNEAEPRPAA